MRPVGEAVPIWPAAGGGSPWPNGYQAQWMDSGTSALALAVRAAMDRTPAGRHRVLLPAYTCPDVCSAILWAGGTPVAVDTRAGSPWLDEDAVSRCLDSSTAAVVVPHFLGLRHPLSTLVPLCREAGAILIEDSAQVGPGSEAFRPESDMVVLSFGRGKPIPVGGGVLLFRPDIADTVRRLAAGLPVTHRSSGTWRLRCLLQNLAMTGTGYAIVRALPWLRVGETYFRPLSSPRRLTGSGVELAERVIVRWIPRSMGVPSGLRDLAHEVGALEVATSPGDGARTSLLRYPILLRDATERDRALRRLEAASLGATALYQAPLPHLAGMPGVPAPCGVSNAEDFAKRLLTLPCHSGVRPKDIARMRAVCLHGQ